MLKLHTASTLPLMIGLWYRDAGFWSRFGLVALLVQALLTTALVVLCQTVVVGLVGYCWVGLYAAFFAIGEGMDRDARDDWQARERRYQEAHAQGPEDRRG